MCPPRANVARPPRAAPSRPTARRAVRPERSERWPSPWSSDCRHLGLRRDVDTEIRADLIAEHAADAVLLLGGVHGEPAEAVRRLAPGEHVHRTHGQTEAARLAHVLGDDNVPAARRSP